MDVELRKQWYARPDVQANIIKCCTEREVAFMVPYSLRTEKGNYPVRCVKAHHSSYLLNNMRAFNFFDRSYNLYHSIFVLEGMPMFSYSPMVRKEQQINFFKEYYDHVIGLDFVMDFDGDKTLPLNERIEASRQQVLKVCGILDSYQVPYCVMFSGSKGFHVEVRDFPPTRDWKQRTHEFAEVAARLILTANERGSQFAKESTVAADYREELLHRYSFDSSIYTVTRIWKVPYSYDVSTDMICAPLTTEELINWDLQKYTAVAMLERNHWNAGLKTRTGTISGFWSLAASLGVDHADETEKK